MVTTKTNPQRAKCHAEILQSRPVSECCAPFCGRERTPINSVEANGPRGGQYSGPLSLNFCNLDKG